MKALKMLTVGLLGLYSATSSAYLVKDVEVYGKAGLPGFGVGVGYALHDKVTVRGDFASLGAINRDFKQRDIDYHAKLKNDKLNVMFDFFPFDNGLRVTSGLGFLSTKLTATGTGRSASNQTFKIGNKTYNIAIDGNDNINASLTYPSVSPYIGLGYGHHIKQQNGGEWGFLFDVGMYLGKGKTSIGVSSSLMDKLVAAEQELGVSTERAQQLVNERINNEKSRFTDKVDKFRVLPAISLGVSYRF